MEDKRVLSPGRQTAKRFFRNRLALVGLVILGLLFLFSFVGGWLTPYRQDQVFYREELQRKEYAAVTENQVYYFTTSSDRTPDTVLQARLTLALQEGNTTVTYQDTTYTLTPLGQDLYDISVGDRLFAIAHKDLLQDTENRSFLFLRETLIAYTNGAAGFSYGGTDYSLSPDGTLSSEGKPVGHISRFLVKPKITGDVPDREFRDLVEQTIQSGVSEFSHRGRDFSLVYDSHNRLWSIREETATRVWDSYSAPSKEHPLGTDKNGMDMLTRLMYGGRVSLVIGFLVVAISALLGVVMGGIAGYFGGWVDGLIMRLVDIFYCIPSTPLLIILGAAMDALRVDPQLRMLFLMLILGFLGWPSIARLVRGQILSLREQEFMTAAEAAGLGAGRRIFHHLIPNVVPQLIVTCTMSLGSTILTEATLSFLGLGVKFPFASWGNIINDVGNVHVLTSYWFVWIPAGVCLVLSVLGFNFVGDGLRDAFDPKMKR